MTDCTRCNTEIIGDDFFKCDGSCGKVYHISCAGPGSGVTKAFHKLFIENEYFMFMCTLCRKSSLKAVNEKMNKVISTIAINDERVTRNTEDMKNLKLTLDELNAVTLKGVIDTISELKEVVRKQTADNNKKQEEKVNEEIVEIKKVLDINRKELTENIRKMVIGKQKTSHSYADSVKQAVTDNAVLVKPKQAQESAKTKDAVKTNIMPNNIEISGVHNVSNGGVIIRCATKESMNDFKQAALDKLSNDYEITIPEPFKPKIKIIGYSDSQTAEEIEQCLKNQNQYIRDNANAYVKVVRIEKAKVSKFESFNILVEVDGNTYKNAMMNRRINVQWQRCKVVSCLDLQRCFKCSGFNHKSVNCNSPMACPRCAEEHNLKDCTNQIQKCINCVNANKRLSMNLDTAHCVWSQNCKIHIRMMDQKRRRLDLGE